MAWDAVDTWFEEGRQLVTYPPNPIRALDSSLTPPAEYARLLAKAARAGGYG